ncbi:MAG: MazG family protein [Clostridia bacterium]|nr:MazG family protein [Clostridia bacterium]
MQFVQKDNYRIEDLLAIMKMLRAPEGCPWDREQTHRSIRKDLLEEAYEAAEAIDADSDDMMLEEFGDVLLQVVFHSEIAHEEGRFDFDAVCDTVCKKLIVRHPHVFGDVSVADSEEVLTNWNKIKQETKGNETPGQQLRAVSKALPALMRGQKIAKHAVNNGLLAPTPTEENAAQLITEHLWQAVRLAHAAKLDAEELFTKTLDEYVSAQQ